MKEINPQNIPQQELHSYLVGSVAPRPIALASTVSKDGAENLSPFSFFNVFSSNPPVLIISPAKSGKTGSNKHTLENVREVPEIVINVVTMDIVHQASLASGSYPKGVSEFVKSGLTPLPSKLVKPPRVKESPVHMECKVLNIIETGREAGAGNLVIAEILLLHINETIFDESNNIDPDKINLVARMGGAWYCRASGRSLFKLTQPKNETGIGVDAIPEHIRNNAIFTGKNLGQLGSVASLPSQNELKAFRAIHMKSAGNSQNANAANQKLIFNKAKELLELDRIEEAWKMILSISSP